MYYHSPNIWFIYFFFFLEPCVARHAGYILYNQQSKIVINKISVSLISLVKINKINTLIITHLILSKNWKWYLTSDHYLYIHIEMVYKGFEKNPK